MTTSPAAIGAPRQMDRGADPQRQHRGARSASPGKPIAVSLPAGTRPWLRITATRHRGRFGGFQFGISEVSLEDYSQRDAPVTVADPAPHRAAAHPGGRGRRGLGSRPGTARPHRLRRGARTGCGAVERLRCRPRSPARSSARCRYPNRPRSTPRADGAVAAGPALDALLAEPGRPSPTGRPTSPTCAGRRSRPPTAIRAPRWTAPQDTTQRQGREADADDRPARAHAGDRAAT